MEDDLVSLSVRPCLIGRAILIQIHKGRVLLLWALAESRRQRAEGGGREAGRGRRGGEEKIRKGGGPQAQEH